MSKPKDEQGKVRPHKADGIEEYDNPMPNWWLGLFYLTIAFSIAYMLYLHVFDGKTLIQELADDSQASIAATDEAAQGPPEGGSPPPVEDLSARLRDAALIAEGKEVYTTNCIACHGALGEGGVGPNLTDDYWIHGGSDADILRTIAKGVPEKGMLAWEPILGKKKVEAATAYVITLHGTNPPGGKAPQGDLFKRE